MAYLGKNVLVTGTDRGIGLALVAWLAKEAEVKRVFAAALNPANAKELEALAKKHPQIRVLQMDVTNDESIQRAAQLVEKEVEAEGVGLLINNAGIRAEPETGTPQRPKRDEILRVYNVNVLGVACTTAAFLPLLHKAAADSKRKSKVLNITSALGSRVYNKDGVLNDFAYPASKSALNMYTHILSTSEREIIALAVCPGHNQTDMGGPEAPLTTDQSVPVILKTIAGATIKDSGKYVHRDDEVIVA